jgi:peptide/nickel transport system substrate-binding protein
MCVMNERELRGLIGAAKSGTISRRNLMRRLVAAGLSAPIASQLLVHAGVAMARSRSDYNPTRRGGGGQLKILLWQAPRLLTPHFASGNAEREAARLFYEPLAGWDNDGNLRAVLAAEIPSRENGMLAADGKSVVWKMKQGVTWHDGKPFTADDVVFTWEFSRDPASATTTIATYRDIVVEKLDDYSVIIRFATSTPFWALAFVGYNDMILPRHLFADYKGDRSRDAPTNMMPVGTGPYRCTAFKPADSVTGVINTAYHLENRPFFDGVVVKGGGDAVSAARAVLQTGEYDFAWNMQIEEEVLARLEKGGKGRIVVTNGGGIEHIRLNTADPWTEVDGERASHKTRHPLLSDPAVRQALALLVDRASIEKFIYGRAGVATANYINNPERFRSKSTRFEFSVDKANELLDKAGWKSGSDGVREKDGKKLKLVFQTTVNQPRQKTQAIIKQACQKAGIDLELKAVVASTYFSADIANPDTASKFYCDLAMHTSYSGVDPELFMRQFCSWEMAAKENKWSGRNTTRWRNKQYDETFKAAQVELDPEKRAAMLVSLNDLVVNDNVVIPVVSRPDVAAVGNGLSVELSGWDCNTWDLPNWHRKG